MSGNAPLSLKQNMVWNSIGCLVYQGCQWAITIAVVVLSPDYSNSGYLAYAMAIGNVYNPLATYNMRTIQVSDVEDKLSPNVYIGFRIVTAVSAAALVAVYLSFTASSITLISVSLCWLLFKADEAYCCVYYAIEQKHMRMDYIGISQAVRGILSIVSFSVLLYLFSDIFISILGMSVCCIFVTVAYDCKKARLFGSVKPEMFPRLAIELSKTYFPAVLTLVCYGAVVSVARQIFEGAHGAEALGMYAAVATPTVLIQVAASYLYNPMLVGIAKSWITKDFKHFVKTIGAVLAAIVALSAAMLLLAALFGEQALVLVFGESIRDCAYLLVPALIATSVTTVFAFVFDILITIRCFSGALAANLLSLAISVCGSSQLIDMLYMNGINAAISLSFGAGIIIGLCFLAFRIHVARKK